MDERDGKTFERIGIDDLSRNLAEVLREVQQGTSFVVTARGQEVAEIRPPEPRHIGGRKPGRLKGRIRMANDFDTLPADILASMERSAT